MSRLGSRTSNWFRRWFGSPGERRLARAALLIDRIRHWESEYDRLADAELRATSMRLRGRARGGEKLDRLLPEAFGLVTVSAKRAIQLRLYDVQLAGAVVLHHGALAELATGEGKTLTAVPAAYLNALAGKGVHVTTVNDYLAKRDCEWMQPVLEILGMSAAPLQMQMPDPARLQAYKSDVTYGMASEFGFDFLRDRLRLRSQGQAQAQPFWVPWDALPNGAVPPQRPAEQRVQPEVLNYAIVDEADSILIDEARTPLIIATATQRASPEEQIVYHWADGIARQVRYQEHYTFDPKKQKIELTDAGRHLSRYANPPGGPHSHAMDKLFEHVERAIFAHVRYRLDQHYMIEETKDGPKIVIIDEYTGRRMPDRHWREGLHQAVEAKERVPINKPTEHAAQITFQNFFKLYKKLAGMTGTARPNDREFRRVYKLHVVVVPTNRPVVREQLPDRVFPSEDAKFAAAVETIKKLREAGRPVLVGTRSVEKSEKLSQMLTEAGVPHEVLNARQHELEAKVVSRAGEAGAVTIATNMAGRGTDIKLGQGVAEAGGLFVLGTERHDAQRIDRQLAGRCGRQGDPGNCQFFLSLEDELVEALGPNRQEQLLEERTRPRHDWDRYRPEFLVAQRRTEARHFKQRIDLMSYDKQRQEVLKELGADPYVD
ncbi:MAG TPA: preprotein translocase subunit SecA [Gemmatales bacterium]|nr:preprotein translocase subunit SecA [Gemmatales bacterium]HMP58122.1 preprotein translocase subunit SecA [Gemmatales bacterium]